MSICFCSLSFSLSDVSLSKYLLFLLFCVLFHVFNEFLVGVTYRFVGGKIDEGNFFSGPLSRISLRPTCSRLCLVALAL